MTYFVTGATGFIGRHLVEELLANRRGDIHVLVRTGSKKKLAALIEGWGPEAAKRVKPVPGDLAKPRLGVSKKWVAEHQGKVKHVFHLAAIYDMTADDEANELLNNGGTRHAVEFANAVKAGCLHHTSSVAAAGSYKGLFREDMFDEGQKLPSAYHRTKFESEKIARTESEVPWRVYRPAVVVGHSQTGAMDKIDGPYYFFQAIQKLRDMLPQWLPLIGPELGHTNIVPVDFVAKAMDHIAHQKGLDGQAFHLTAPKSTRSGDVLNTFSRVAHAPQLAIRVDKRLTDSLPKGTISMLMKLPALKGIRDGVLNDFGIPPEVIEHVGFNCQFDTRDTERALKGSGIEVPPLDDYADVLWQYYERHLDPNLFKDRSFEAAVKGKIVMITGASSGIGESAAHKFAAAGAIPLLVARSHGQARGAARRARQGRRDRPRLLGGPHEHGLHRGSRQAGDRRPRTGRHPGQQRGSLDPPVDQPQPRALPRLRAHDAAELLRRDQARHVPAAQHAGEAGSARSSTCPRSACRPHRRGSAPTSRRSRPSTGGPASCPRRSSATACTSRPSTCRWCGRR